MLAYQSADTGRWQVYVQRLADARRVMVSTTGGDRPTWSRDGSFLYYRTESSLVRVPISRTPEGPKIGDATPVGTHTGASIAGIAPDGRLLIDSPSSDALRRAVMALGWVRETRQALGPPAAQMPR